MDVSTKIKYSLNTIKFMTPLNIQKLHTSEAPFGRDLVISYKIETVLFMHHAYRI